MIIIELVFAGSRLSCGKAGGSVFLCAQEGTFAVLWTSARLMVCRWLWLSFEEAAVTVLVRFVVLGLQVQAVRTTLRRISG